MDGIEQILLLLRELCEFEDEVESQIHVVLSSMNDVAHTMLIKAR